MKTHKNGVEQLWLSVFLSIGFGTNDPNIVNKAIAALQRLSENNNKGPLAATDACWCVNTTLNRLSCCHGAAAADLAPKQVLMVDASRWKQSVHYYRCSCCQAAGTPACWLRSESLETELIGLVGRGPALHERAQCLDLRQVYRSVMLAGWSATVCDSSP